MVRSEVKTDTGRHDVTGSGHLDSSSGGLEGGRGGGTDAGGGVVIIATTTRGTGAAWPLDGCW